MKKNTWYQIICLLLTVMIAVHHALPALAQDSDSGSRGNDTGNPLTVDYVLPDWEADPVIDPPVRVKPAVYEDGTILIYHYQQLLLIGKMIR